VEFVVGRGKGYFGRRGGTAGRKDGADERGKYKKGVEAII
jgi:hypothetical protein